MRPDDATIPLSIRLFGPVEVRLAGRPLPQLAFRKSLWVLAWLALRDGREVERDALAAALWSEAVQSSALHSLRNCLTDLRRALGPESDRLRSPTPRTLCLQPSGAFIDVLAFDAAIARGDLEGLEEAVALYWGPLLAGCADAWAFQERQPREQALLEALERLAARARERGDPAAAERHLRRAVATDPFRESAHRALMTALAAGGNYAAALLAYRELRVRLHRDLNAEPDAETRALFQQLRAEARRVQERSASRARVESGKPRVETPAAARPSPPANPNSPPPTPAGTELSLLSTLNPQLSTSAGENRLVTVLFADMSRSVETTKDLHPEEAAALVNRLLEVMVDAILQFGGRVDRFLGDGLLGVFGLPQAHEDDAERAIRAALEIRENAARLGHSITAGINTGVVYAGTVGTERHHESTVVGPVVNLASRLQEQARSGQVLAGEATYRVTHRAFEFSPQSFAARETGEPIPAYALTGARARPEKTRGIEGLRAPLIGRDEELSKLRSALSRIFRPDTPAPPGAGGARGQIVTLIGEAGVGKSRLIAELKGEGTRDEGRGMRANVPVTSLIPHPSSLLWLEGRCLEFAATDRYSLFVDLLRHYFAWPAEEEEARQVARIDAILRNLAGSGGLSAVRAAEIGPLLADLFSLRWGQERGDANHHGVGCRVKAGTRAAGDGSEPADPTRYTLHPTPSDPEQRRHQTFLAIRDFLLALARQRPLVLVLEDLHWADSLSLDLISLLMESLSPAPLLLLCSFRPDPEQRCSRLGTVAAQKCPESYTELRLRELTPTQSQQLVASLLGTPELPPPVKALILDRSRGNPFFTEELVHALLDRGVLYQQKGAWQIREGPASLPVPESVQGMILSRVDRLEPELKRLLQHAAVLGRVFQRRLLEAVVDSGQWLVGSSGSNNRRRRPSLSTNHCPLSTTLWALEERGLIYQERAVPEEEYSFRHVLLQETVYESILRSQRAGLHLQVAEAIERLYEGRLEAYYEQLAFHYEQASLAAARVRAAGESAGELAQQRALEYLILAAERAHRTAAHREEAARLEHALAIAERLGRREQLGELHARRGTALSRLGRMRDARVELETALAKLPPDQSERRAEILIDLANVAFWGVEGPLARPYATEAMALAEAARRDDLAGTALAWLAVADQKDGELRASVEHYEQAMKKAGGLRTAPVMANAPLTRYLLGEYREALRLAREAVAQIRRLNNTSATMYGLSHLGLALAANGHYAEAMSVFAEARHFGIEYEVGHFVARAAAMSAGLHLDIYDFEGNEARAEEARDLARQASFMPSVVSAGIDLLLNFARRGEVERTERLVDEVAAGAAQVGGWHGWLWKLRLAQARAEIALARGDAEEAERLAGASIDQSRRRERVKYQVAGLITRGQALAAQQRCREALSDLCLAVDLSRPTGDPALLLRAAAARLALDGDGDLAAEARAAASQIAAALPDDDMRRRFAAAEPVRLLGISL